MPSLQCQLENTTAMIEAFFQKVWEAISVASPAAAMVTFLFLLKAWRDEERQRIERLATSKDKDVLIERTLNGLNDAARSADKLADVVNALATLIKETSRARRE